MKADVLAVFIIGLVTCVGCQNAEQLPTAQLGPEKIGVFVGGEVEHPNVYQVAEGTTLAAMPSLAGGLRVCKTCGNAPTVVYVFSQANPNVRKRHHLNQTKKLQSVRLRDKDHLTYATRHW